MNVGLKAENISYNECKCNHGNILSFATSYNYYFHSTGKCSSSFIGAGLGYYFCETRDNHFIEREYYYSKYNNPVFCICSGFEIKKVRMSLVYNFIRKPNEMNPSDRNRDYVSLTIGFFIGGGKWK